MVMKIINVHQKQLRITYRNICLKKAQESVPLKNIFILAHFAF